MNVNSAPNAITALTRRNILDFMRMEMVAWWGAMEEADFVARVWTNAGELPSNDPRFATALADIHQHRWLNNDWDDDWVYTDWRFNLLGGSDEKFLAFLSETVHPLVRPDEETVGKLVEEFNRHLRRDGFRLTPRSTISGHTIYGGTRASGGHHPATALGLPKRTLLEDHSALQDHLDAIERDLVSDPAGAIAGAKELVESMYKLILDKRGVAYGNEDLPKLYKKVAVDLRLAKESVPQSAKGSEAAYKVLTALNTTVFGLAELRNQLGRGHGRSTASPALERHARLAFNTAVTLTEFLYDTLQDRED